MGGQGLRETRAYDGRAVYLQISEMSYRLHARILHGHSISISISISVGVVGMLLDLNKMDIHFLVYTKFIQTPSSIPQDLKHFAIAAWRRMETTSNDSNSNLAMPNQIPDEMYHA